LVLDKKDSNIYYFNQEEIVVKENYNGYSVIENAGAFKSDAQFLVKGAFNLLGE
jgi:cobalt-zinc-cadmium efflux system membrane fusion protein